MNDSLSFFQGSKRSGLAAICLLTLLAACAKEDPLQYVDEGKTLFGKGELESARVQFQNALQIKPELAEAHFGLALIDEKKQNWPAMLKDLQETVRLDPRHLDAQVKLGHLYAGQVDKAKQQADIALKLDPENIAALLLDGAVQFREGHGEQASSQVERVLAKDATNVDALLLKATMLSAEKRFEEALAALVRGIEANPDNLSLRLMKIRLLAELKKTDEVVSDYAMLVAKFPENKKLRRSQFEFLTFIGKDGLAEQVIRDAIANDPGDVDVKLALVAFLERKDQQQAEGLLKQYVAAYPQEFRLAFYLAEFYLARQRHVEAQAVLQAVVDVDPAGKEGLAAKGRLAQIALQQGDKPLADRLVQEILDADAGNTSALTMRADMRLQQKDTDGAIADLRIVLRDQPNSAQAMVKMAASYQMKDETEVAESYLRKAIEADPANQPAILALAGQMIQRGDALRAEEVLAKALKTVPDNPLLLEMMVKVKAANKDWPGAEAAVAELKKLPQSELTAQMLSGMLAAGQGRHDHAIKFYQEILTVNPNATEALLAMARSYGAAGRRADFVAYLQTFVEQHPENIGAYNALALAYVSEKKWADAGRVLRQALTQNAESVSSYTLLGDVLLKQGKADEAEALYRKGLRLLPANPDLMMALAAIHEFNQDAGQAIALYEELLLQFPENRQVANNLSYLLAEYGSDAADINRARRLVEPFKDSKNPYFLDTYAWVLFKAGEVDNALALLKSIVSASPNNASFSYHLGEAYHKAGDIQASKAALEKFLSLAAKQGRQLGVARAKAILQQLDATVDG